MALLHIFLCAIVITAASHVNCYCELNVTDNSVVNSYESKLVLSEKYKNVVLVLGNSGNGMSTVTQWIAGDDSKLKSIDYSEGLEEYIIADNDKIGTSLTSKTVFPELVIDKETDTAYYDMPSFHSTKGSEYDIATRYFIKRILDHVDSIKLLLVVPYITITQQEYVKYLIKDFKYFIDLVNDIDKYSNGIGLVVTKVQNKYTKNADGEQKLVNDHRMMTRIARHLRELADEVKEAVEAKTSPENRLLSDKVFCEKSIKLINLLLGSDSVNGPYKKIALFRKPDREGLVKEIPQLQQEKMFLRDMVSKNLQFIPKQNDDFCYKVSLF